MSRKVMDCCNRWRSKTVSFRMSPEEDALLDSMVRLSGMTKQDYIIARLLKFEITVQGNPKVYKAMKQELALRPPVRIRFPAGFGLGGEAGSPASAP